jgi:hypothetical protein
LFFIFFHLENNKTKFPFDNSQNSKRDWTRNGFRSSNSFPSLISCTEFLFF